MLNYFAHAYFVFIFLVILEKESLFLIKFQHSLALFCLFNILVDIVLKLEFFRFLFISFIPAFDLENNFYLLLQVIN